MYVVGCLLFGLFFECESASISKKNDTFEVLKNDVSQVTNAVENFTFDILKEVFEDEENEDIESVTVVSDRMKRSTDEEVWKLCRKQCQEEESLEAKQIKELKLEVKKLQEIVQVIQGQQKIIEVLDHTNSTDDEKKYTRSELEDESLPNNKQLALIKIQLQDVVNSLNETKEIKKQEELLEIELRRQNEEIEDLKTRIDELLWNTTAPHARASELSGIRKLLKNLPNDDDVDVADSDDIHFKIMQLEKQLKKKRRQESLASELKELEKSLDQKDTNGDLVEQLIKAIAKTQPKSRTDDEVSNLSDLQEAINKLRPKEDENAQFQAMLTKLINNPVQTTKPQISVTPQQMNQFTNKSPQNNFPYVCVINDGGKNGRYPAPPPPNYRGGPYYTPPQPDLKPKRGQFFPGPIPQPNYNAQPNYNTQPNYNSQPNANGNPPEKTGSYSGENGEYNQKYRDDLRQQIDGLQGAIDNLNRPEYAQRPEDKAVIDDLERQIDDLRNVVQNLNYDNYQTVRHKRSLENNQIEDAPEIIGQVVTEIVKTLNLTNDTQNPDLQKIQNNIDSIKKQLVRTDSKSRSADEEYPSPVPNFSTYLAPQAETSDLKRSGHNDIFLDIVAKILDKVIASIPIVIQKLFSFSLDELSKYDYQDYDIQVLFKNLGVFAYLPVILLRLLKGVTSFLSILKKNNFFRYFLLPAIILAIVAGSVLFLIWWLQSDDYHYSNYTSYYPDQSYNPQPQYPTTPNTPIYNRSYFNK